MYFLLTISQLTCYAITCSGTSFMSNGSVFRHRYYPVLIFDKLPLWRQARFSMSHRLVLWHRCFSGAHSLTNCRYAAGPLLFFPLLMKGKTASKARSCTFPEEILEAGTEAAEHGADIDAGR